MTRLGNSPIGEEEELTVAEALANDKRKDMMGFLNLYVIFYFFI